MHARYFALVPAAGGGIRFGGRLPKQYLSLAGEPLLAHTLRAIAHGTPIGRTFVILSAMDIHYAALIGPRANIVALNCGGSSRAESVRNGLLGMRGEVSDHDWVLVHDAARPCLSRADVDKLVDALSGDSVGGLLAVPVADTLKRSTTGPRISATVSRENLWQAQTPQMFRYGQLVEALASNGGLDVTDEAEAIERLGHSPKLVEGSRSNIKVTYPEDLELAEAILHSRVNNPR